MLFFFFQAEDGIRDLVRSRGLGDVYKRQSPDYSSKDSFQIHEGLKVTLEDQVDDWVKIRLNAVSYTHLTLPTSDLV